MRLSWLEITPSLLMKCIPAMALSVLLSACSSTPAKEKEQEEEAAELPEFTEQVELDVRWRQTLGKGPGSVFNRLYLAEQGGDVYAADASGDVYSLNLEDGSQNWKVTLDQPIISGVTLAGEQLFVVTKDGLLHCLSAADGESIWQAVLSSESIAPVGYDAGRVFVHTIDGRVSAFERTDGRQAWSYENAMPVLTVRGTSSPLVLDNLVITGFATGKVVALDKVLGIPRWDKRLATPDGRSELERLVDIDGTPVWEDGRIYASSYHGKLASISLQGETEWEEEGSSYTSPVLALGNIYLTLDDSSVQAYDQRNGAVQWLQTALSQRNLGKVVAVGNHLLVADNEGYLHALRQVDGELVGRLLMRPKPLHISYPNQSEMTNWRLLRGRDFGIRSHMVNTREGVLVYTNAGDLALVTLEKTGDDSQ